MKKYIKKDLFIGFRFKAKDVYSYEIIEITKDSRVIFETVGKKRSKFNRYDYKLRIVLDFLNKNSWTQINKLYKIY